MSLKVILVQATSLPRSIWLKIVRVIFILKSSLFQFLIFRFFLFEGSCVLLHLAEFWVCCSDEKVKQNGIGFFKNEKHLCGKKMQTFIGFVSKISLRNFVKSERLSGVVGGHHFFDFVDYFRFHAIYSIFRIYSIFSIFFRFFRFFNLAQFFGSFFFGFLIFFDFVRISFFLNFYLFFLYFDFKKISRGFFILAGLVRYAYDSTSYAIFVRTSDSTVWTFKPFLFYGINIRISLNRFHKSLERKDVFECNTGASS